MDRPRFSRVVPPNTPGVTLPLSQVEAALQAVLDGAMDEVDDTSPEHLSDMLRDITDAAKDATKRLQVPRYKYCVHGILFPNRGQGVDAATQTFWDEATDACITVRKSAGGVECVLSLYAVYLY